MKILARINMICLFVLFSFQINAQISIPPIVRHPLNSRLPDTLHIVGTVVGLPLAGSCGILCVGGTMKIKLSKQVEGYPYKYVYLTTACFNDKLPKNSNVVLTASKLKENEIECYYNSVRNKYDSKGVPFYKISEKESLRMK